MLELFVKQTIRPAGVTALSVSSFIISVIMGRFVIMALPALAFGGVEDNSYVVFLLLPLLLFVLAIHLWRMMWFAIYLYLLSGLCVGFISFLLVESKLLMPKTIEPRILLSFIIFYSLYFLCFVYLLKKRNLFH